PACTDQHPIFLLAKLKASLATYCHRRDLIFDADVIDRSRGFNLPTGLVTSFHIIAANYKLRVTVYDEVGVVAGENKLAVALCLPYLPHNLRAHLAVDVVLGLINDKRSPGLVK